STSGQVRPDGRRGAGGVVPGRACRGGADRRDCPLTKYRMNRSSRMKNVQVNGKTYQPHELFEVVEEILPYDGPHDSVSIVVATEVLAHTARQLANATQSPNLLGDTSDMYHVAANLSTSMRS